MYSLAAPCDKVGLFRQVLSRFAGEITEGEQAAEDFFSSLLDAFGGNSQFAMMSASGIEEDRFWVILRSR
jgi:hypothetical protein